MTGASDEDFPRDVWVDIETGEWGLASNLRLIRQVDLPTEVGSPLPENGGVPKRAVDALVRCAGLDKGVRVTQR